MIVSEIRKCGMLASHHRISHGLLDTDRKLATHVIFLLVSNLCHLLEEWCLCLFSRASAAMAHRDHCALSPQACRQP